MTLTRRLSELCSNNLPYKINFPTQRLVLCTKTAMSDREWCHFKPFQSSPRGDWNMHDEWPDNDAIPGATFGSDVWHTHSPDPCKPGIATTEDALRAELAATRAELDAMRNATFWRMTAPLRAMVNWRGA
jgi:hypothetical protein